MDPVWSYLWLVFGICLVGVAFAAYLAKWVLDKSQGPQ
ncbi:hypothetical protein KIPB_015150, partial [Kipferlia bialata]|eukprot:g15150.t1